MPFSLPFPDNYNVQQFSCLPSSNLGFKFEWNFSLSPRLPTHVPFFIEFMAFNSVSVFGRCSLALWEKSINAFAA
jgi:hypothetical protein